MLGVVIRSLEDFVRETRGDESWATVVSEGRLPATFEPFLHFPPETLERAVTATVDVLEKPRTSLLEDVGHFLVTGKRSEPVRRLLRFGGMTFPEFLHSLDDLPERIALAFPDLRLADIEVIEVGRASVVTLKSQISGLGHVMAGLIRAMADDYGALATVKIDETEAEPAQITVMVLSSAHGPGRDFRLGVGAAALP